MTHTTKTTKKEKGVVLLQIDGLSRYQFERALKTRRFPFLSKLLQRTGYQTYSFYPGQPSCTPAVQAEIHYGKRCATPAFSFFDRETGRAVKMYDAEWAQRISTESQETGEGLLQGGSSYANIYTGGASKAKYCGEVNTFSHWTEELSPWTLLKKACRYPLSALRVLKLVGIEIGIGFYDALKGVFSRGDLLAELKFIPARVGVAIALREAICSEVEDDIENGLPIIHANFFGYDEAAHRRGPQSRFAHWSLKGIDRALKKICKAASKSEARDYEVIIFSDHGQEATTPFHELTGESIHEQTEKVLSEHSSYQLGDHSVLQATMERAKAYFAGTQTPAPGQPEKKRAFLQAMGPIAHLTFEGEINPEQKEDLARNLALKTDVPYILFLDTEGNVRCFKHCKQGSLEILEQDLEARKHPFVDLTIKDLETLVRSKYSGDLVFLAWRHQQKPLTFADERGAHAGPGAEECQGFVLLPPQIPYPQNWMRPVDLREICLQQLGRIQTKAPASLANSVELPIRVLSYNVHGGVGVDRRRNQDRLAAVMKESKADILCFQEAYRAMDANKQSLYDSVCEAWGTTDFDYRFLPLHSKNGYEFGLAIASKVPLHVRKEEGFNLTHHKTASREPRGAIWVELMDAESNKSLGVHVLNTHFGLQSLERRLQASALTSEDWLANLAKSERVILCGDLNSGPKGKAYQLLADKFTDSLLIAENGGPAPSFLSWAPLRRIDHIFTSGNLRIPKAGVHRSPLSRWASDHLPIFADITERSVS